MKRISFFLAFVLTVFALGAAQAQTYEVVISASGPAVLDANTIGYNLGSSTLGEQGQVTWTIHFNSSDNVVGFQNGFRIFDNGSGVDWTVPTLAQLYNLGDFGIFNAFTCFNCDGAAVDTLGLAAGTISGGFAPPVNLDVATVTTNVNPSQNPAFDGTQICFDSSTTYDSDQGLPWKWGLPGNVTVFPDVIGGKCWDVVFVPDQPPEISNAPVDIIGDHCGTLTYDFDSQDPDGCVDSPTFELVSGPGTIDPSTGVWSYNPSIGDVGAGLTIDVRVCCPSTNCGTPVTVNVVPTNTAPFFTQCPTGQQTASAGSTYETTVAADDDCTTDVITYSIVTPLPAGVDAATVDAFGNVSADIADGFEGLVLLQVEANDGNAGATCDIEILVSIGATYGVVIEKDEGESGNGALQGQFAYVDVTLETAAQLPGAFDFLIGYDASALTFMEASVENSALYSEFCGWEYFTYRTGPFGNCGGGCPTGMVSVVGIAETNDGPNHPYMEDDVITCPQWDGLMFQLKFLVSSDRNLECSYVPIYFTWVGCTDNTMSNQDGDVLFEAYRVFRYTGFEGNLYAELFNYDTAVFYDEWPVFPSTYGPEKRCYDGNVNPDKPQPEPDIDFYNGGVDIICAHEIDDRGDINLNNIPYEIADAVIFTNYFIYGQSAFEILAPDGSGPYEKGLAVAAATAASDVNADGLTLTVGDLVYLIRVIVGDAAAVPDNFVGNKLNAVDVNFTVSDGALRTDANLGAIYLELDGAVEVTSRYDVNQAVVGNTTRVIIYSMDHEVLTGEVANIAGASITHSEMAMHDGSPVRSLELPSEFSVAQNYPNPFNPTTTIEFSIPSASDVSVKIYNVTGQLVTEMNGSYDAGTHQVVWNGANAASGVYFYRVVTDNSEVTKKMVLLK